MFFLDPSWAFLPPFVISYNVLQLRVARLLLFCAMRCGVKAQIKTKSLPRLVIHYSLLWAVDISDTYESSLCFISNRCTVAQLEYLFATSLISIMYDTLWVRLEWVWVSPDVTFWHWNTSCLLSRTQNLFKSSMKYSVLLNVGCKDCFFKVDKIKVFMLTMEHVRIVAHTVIICIYNNIMST